MVIGEGMNKAANDILDPACPSGKALRGALGVCLAGSTYPIADVLVSDLCLGFHPVDGAKPRAWAWCGRRRVFLGVCATIGGGGERAGPLEEERRRQ